MNLKRLNTFFVLSECKSFTKTAEKLGCAQSGVTAQIGKLEEDLGVRLFNRIGKAVSLTAEGEQLIPYARRMLSLSAQMENLCRFPGRLTVGVTESIASYLFEDILKEYTALYPDVEIFLKILDREDYCRMLADGEIDSAIVLDLPVRQRHIKVLGRRRENITLFASPTHELSGKTHISPEAFLTHAVLLPPPDCPYRRLFEHKLFSEGIRPKIALETASLHVIKKSSLCGIGLGLLPEFAVKKELIYHIFEKINYKLDFPVCTQVLVHQDKWISPKLEAFLSVAQRHLNVS